MIRTVITFLIVVCLKVPIYTQAIHEKLTHELEIISKDNSIEGLGVAVFSKGTVLYSRGFGVASKQDDKIYTIRTRQKIASISKLLLGVSLLKAQELGLLDLDDNVNDYLPFVLTNPYFPDEVITIRHLANHTSGLAKIPKYDLKALYMPTKITKIKREMRFGIKRWFFNRTIKKINANKEYFLKEFLSNLYSPNGKWYRKKHFMKVRPGMKTTYSNTGASLLALVIEQAVGISYEEFVRAYISIPLNMKDSGFDFEPFSSDESSHYYHSGINIPNDFRLLLYPAGGFETTIEDFAKFMSCILSGSSILSKQSIQEMLSPQLEAEYGILWEVYPSGYVGHTGDILGVTTIAYYNVKKDIGYLLFCNTAETKAIEKEIEEIRKILKSHFKKFGATDE